MEGNSLSFEENVQMIFKRWEPQLKPSNSFFTGILIATQNDLDKKKLALIKQLFIGFNKYNCFSYFFSS
jgi:hypothetical protein